MRRGIFYGWFIVVGIAFVSFVIGGMGGRSFGCFRGWGPQMRGDPGEWNWAQVPLGRAIRPILDALGLAHLCVDRPEEAEAVVRNA